MTSNNSPNRRLFDVPLQPISGSRFQPTGFPDIGAALFKRPDRRGEVTEWTDALLLESAQSMANRLEETGWDAGAQDQAGSFAGLPYVRVLSAEGDTYLTSSRTEAHRLASAFVKDSSLEGAGMVDVIRERLRLEDDRPLAPRDIAAAIFAMDPLCLIHGVFFADKNWPGQPKIARALTAFIEAHDVRRADSGGVKRDDVRHSIAEGAGGSSEGYGSIPFHRTEYTAAEIMAYFCLDLAQIRAYGLGSAESDLVETIALWEIRSLLDGNMRLRTACDLEPVDSDITDRDGVSLPSFSELDAKLRDLIPKCAQLSAADGPIEVRWNGGKKPKKN